MEQHPATLPAANKTSLQSAIALVFAALALVLPLLSYPLAILPPGWVIHRFDFRLPWAELAAVALLVVMCRQSRAPLCLPLQAEPPILALLALVFAQTLSALINDTEGRLAWVLRSVCHLMLTLAAAHFLRADGLQRIAGAWTFAAVVQVLLVLLQSACNVEEAGTIGNRNFVAGYLALSLPIGIAWLASRARQRPAFSIGWLMAWLWTFNYAGVLLVGIAVTRSRGAAAALAVAAAAWGFMRLKPFTRWLAAGAVVIAVAMAAMSPALIKGAKTQWRLDVRPAIWQGTVRAIAEAPWVGHGPGSFIRVYPAHRPPEYFDRPKAAPVTDHAHNEFLEVAAETGAAGLIAFLVVLGAGARAARIAVRRAEDPVLRALTVGMTIGLAALLLHNLVDINLRMPPNQTLLWIGLGCLGAAAGAARMDETSVFTCELRRFTRLMAAVMAMLVLVLGVARPVAGDCLFRRGIIAAVRDPARALDSFLWATRIDPDRIEGWRQLGLTAFRMGMQPLALRAMVMAHELAPDYANLNGELGSLLAMQGRHAEAAALLSRATQLYPRDATNFAKLAKALLALNRVPQARAALETALRLDPENPVTKLVAQEMTARKPH